MALKNWLDVMNGDESPFPACSYHRARVGAPPRTFRDGQHGAADIFSDPQDTVANRPEVPPSVGSEPEGILISFGSSANHPLAA